MACEFDAHSAAAGPYLRGKRGGTLGCARRCSIGAALPDSVPAEPPRRDNEERCAVNLGSSTFGTARAQNGKRAPDSATRGRIQPSRAGTDEISAARPHSAAPANCAKVATDELENC